MVAVDGLSMQVHTGQILALLGPNGAGKTTTLLSLAGLLRPDAGRIAWQGNALGPERARAMALIQETPEVYDMLTVWEHMVFVARSCGVRGAWPARAEQLLERLDLTEKRDTLGEALSKGMRQKVLIAAAVLADTPVLLLDEPMIGLDPKGQREPREILVEIRERGAAIIVSTHLLEYIDTLCDSVLILKQGRVLMSGPISEIMHERATNMDKPMRPQVIAHELGKRLPSNAIVASDSGTITTWWARNVPAKRGQMHSCSGNLATMACGLPYAIAAAAAHPDRPVFAFVGDGGFSMLMADFVTAVKYQLPIRVVVIKNVFFAAQRFPHALLSCGWTFECFDCCLCNSPRTRCGF